MASATLMPVTFRMKKSIRAGPLSASHQTGPVTASRTAPTACQRIVAGTQTMTVYKPLTQLAKRAADLAFKLAKRQPLIAKAETDNGKIAVPSVLLDIVAVTRENIRDTVVKDGFRKEADVFGK